MLAVSDHDMVVQCDLKCVRRCLQLAGPFDILAGRFRIARRVVVRDRGHAAMHALLVKHRVELVK